MNEYMRDMQCSAFHSDDFNTAKELGNQAQRAGAQSMHGTDV